MADQDWEIMVTFIACNLLFAALSIPLIMNRIPPNRWYGVRTRKTISGPNVWYPANAYGGKCLIASSVVSMVLTGAAVGLLRSRVSREDLQQIILLAFIIPIVVTIVLTLVRVRKL